MAHKEREPFVSVDAVAEHIDKPTSWVYNNAERLRMPRYRVGNHWRYRLSEIDEWLRAGMAVAR